MIWVLLILLWFLGFSVAILVTHYIDSAALSGEYAVLLSFGCLIWPIVLLMLLPLLGICLWVNFLMSIVDRRR